MLNSLFELGLKRGGADGVGSELRFKNSFACNYFQTCFLSILIH